MSKSNQNLIDLLLKSGNVYRLKCEKCNSISVQISDKEEPDYLCFECGGTCKLIGCKIK